jgi:hypothetical protein
MPMIEPLAGTTYLIELCRGEQHRWRYLGPDARAQIWWRDVESGREFTESSVIYAWQIVRKEDD